jgi:hypothetical protein
MYENSTVKTTKNLKKEGGRGSMEEGEWLRKSNIDEVNLIKGHYMHVVNMIKPLHIINLC